MSSIPKGWMGCPRIANSVIAGKFLVFKTPLDDGFRLNPRVRFTPKDVLDHVWQSGKRIGLWIDLTNTTRYYQAGFIEQAGIQYFKLRCPGHGNVPTQDEIRQFMTTCARYIENQPVSDDSFIAVHCTHGLNRTGYFICTFLSLYTKYPIQAAITNFNERRPPGMYRQIYLDDLLQTHVLRGDEPYPRIIVSDPKWVTKAGATAVIQEGVGAAEDDCESESESRQDVADNPPTSNLYSFDFTFVESPRFFYEDDCIQVLDPVDATVILLEIQALVSQKDFTGAGMTPPRLPFSIPETLSEENLPDILGGLNERKYVVSWLSASSVRYLLYIKGPKKIFFVDSFNTVFQLHAFFTFPHYLNYHEHIGPTLLDGNMKRYAGRDFSLANSIIGYEIDDILAFDGMDVTHFSWNGRQELIKFHVMAPRADGLQAQFFDSGYEYGLPLTKSQYFKCNLLTEMFQKEDTAIPDTFRNYGLLFKPLNKPYSIGESKTNFKWCRSKSSIFEAKFLPKAECKLLVAESSAPWATLTLPAEFSPDCYKFGLNMMVEAAYDLKNEKCWHFIGLKDNRRSDYPGMSIQNAKAMMANPNLTQESILDYIAKNKEGGKSSLF